MTATSRASMDVARPRRRRRVTRYALLAAASLAVLGGGVYTVTRVGPREATVDRASVVTSVVRRGDLVRGIAAAGTFVPERVRVVAAPSDGIVDALPLKAGAAVRAGTTIARLRNPDLEVAVADARAQLVAVQAELRSLSAQARTAQLERQDALGAVRAQREQAAAEERSDRQLLHDGLVAELPYRIALLKVRALRDQEGIERSKLAASAVDQDAKRATGEARVAQMRTTLAARTAQLEALVLRAGSPGVVQTIAAELGQRVTAGATIARIADPRDLKAVISVPEAQAKDVAIGMPARITTPGAVLHGRVARLDPAAQNGGVAADIVFAAPLPPGLRPDSNLDAVVEVARVRGALVIARPSGASDGATLDLYKMAGGNRAVRTTVRLGAGSVDEIEVRSGLIAGDRVIVSDLSAFGGASQLRIP